MTHERRVLIVDDELPIRIFLTRMLKAWGYAVQHVSSAADALQVMTLEPADIILCDVSMPDGDGVSLAQDVHARWPQTAIIMSTARQDPETIQQSRKAGAVAYLTKPFNSYRLREALDRAGAN
jgi:DNA-binding NtrC family response regulator